MSYETRYAAAKKAATDRNSNTPKAIQWRQADNRARDRAKEANPIPSLPVTIEQMRAWEEKFENDRRRFLAEEMMK